jgi:hypothetical protein
MKTRNHKRHTNHGWLAHSIVRTHAAARLRHSLILLIAMAVWTTCAASYAQTVIGSPGAGFQTWTLANLNNNNAPYWDAPTNSFGAYSGNPDSKNAGYCLTGGGDCAGIDSHIHAPGPMPYWGMPYDSVHDANGALDPMVYFHDNGPGKLRATLHLQLSTVTKEINEFGWFETNATGSVVGTRHKLFGGGGVPPGTLTPDPVGTTASFKPTPYFGYYFSDVSEGGCFAYTIVGFNTSGCAGHNFVVFAKDPSTNHSSFWIAGEDPPGCGDGDCNLTLVKVSREE